MPYSALPDALFPFLSQMRLRPPPPWWRTKDLIVTTRGFTRVCRCGQAEGCPFKGATATAQAATMSDVSEVDQKSAERFLKGRAFLGGRCRRGGTGASRANMLDPRFQRSE